MAGYDGSIRINTQLNTRGFERGARGLLSGVERLGNSIRGIMGSLGFAIGIAGLVLLGKQAIDTASDIQEVQNVVDTAFGSMAYKMEEFAKTSVKQFGISQLSAKQMGSTFMAMGASMLDSAETASNMAINLTARAADMSSFYNKSIEETSTALKSIYTGETESLKEYGVVMTQVNLQEFARQQGINKSIQAMTQAEKVELQYAYVMQQTALAAGDFAKTSDSWANQTRILSEQFKELLSVIGSGLIVVFTPVVKFLNTILTGLIAIAKQIGAILSKLFGIKVPVVDSSKMASNLSDAAGGANDLADGMDAAGKSAEKAGKAASKALAPFDKLNVLKQDSGGSGGSGSSGGGGGIGGGAGALGDVDFEKIEEGEAVASELENALKSIWDVFQQAWESKGEGVINSAKAALSSLLEAAKAIGATFYEVFTNGTGLGWLESLLELLRSMFDVVTSISVAFTEAWNSGAGFENVTALFEMLTNVNYLLAAIGDSFSRAFSNGIGVQIWTNILGIITGVYNIIGNLAASLTEAWNTAGIGDSIWAGILEIINTVLETMHGIADSTAEWAAKLDFVPLLESIDELLKAIQPLTQNIGEGLQWFWDNVLLPIAGWTIQEAVPAFLDMLSEAIRTANEVIEALKPLGIWLWENFLQPLGQWAGDVIISAMETITDLLKKFGDWISEHQEAVQNMAIIIGSFFAAFKIVTAVAGIVNFIAKMGGLIGIVQKMAGLIGTVFNPWTLAIGAAIAIGVLLWKNWDKIKEAAGKLKDWITKKWKEILKAISGAWEGIQKALSNVSAWFKKKFDDAIKNVHKAFEGIGGWFGARYKDVTNAFKGVGSWFKEQFDNAVKNTHLAFEAIGSWFGERWGDIQSALSDVGGWFKNKFDDAKVNVHKAFDKIGGWFGERWGDIQKAFKDLGGWFDRNFKKAYSNATKAFSGAKAAFKTIWGNITGAFGDSAGWFRDKFSSAWQSVTGIFSGAREFMAGVGKNIVNGIIDGILAIWNTLVDMANKIKELFNIKVNVSGASAVGGAFGGLVGGMGKAAAYSPQAAAYSPAMASFSDMQIPQLASGAVIRGGNPFLAILGDQPHGQTNIEAPLSTLEKALSNVMKKNSQNFGNETYVFQVDGKTFFEITRKEANMYFKRTGRSAFPI
ncbi:hypothetical protein C806_03052 [Lachnospiraceae bacterium 3-1]|nr:hypothetical protein C806_03052 [Lachnospiraceae bacterium 3-1]